MLREENDVHGTVSLATVAANKKTAAKPSMNNMAYLSPHKKMRLIIDSSDEEEEVVENSRDSELDEPIDLENLDLDAAVDRSTLRELIERIMSGLSFPR